MLHISKQHFSAKHYKLSCLLVLSECLLSAFKCQHLYFGCVSEQKLKVNLSVKFFNKQMNKLFEENETFEVLRYCCNKL